MDVDLLLARILFLTGFSILGLLIGRLLRIDSSIACVIAGVLAGLSLPFFMFDTGVRAHNLQDIVFFFILPVLIFEAAWQLEPALLRRWLIPSLFLAIPGVLIATTVSGALMYYGIGHPTGFPWAAGFLAGAIISATDPSLIISRLRQLDIPRDLPTLMESESLLNDATAVVVFTVVLALAGSSEAPNSASLMWLFSWTFVGGALIGLAGGALTSGLVVLLRGGSNASVVLIFSALACFYLAESVLEVSGIVAVTTAALLSRHLLRHRQQELLDNALGTLEWLGVLLTALLFTLMGLVITFDMFTERWLAILIAIGAGLAARFTSVAASAGMGWVAGYRIPWRWQLLLSWDGARGAVAIALVLTLPTSLPYWWTIQSMVFGVVIFGLLVQAPTTSLLAQRLDLKQSH